MMHRSRSVVAVTHLGRSVKPPVPYVAAVVIVCLAGMLSGQTAETTPSRAAYDVGGNLGFAFTRTQSQNPEQPLNEAGRQWVLNDLGSAYRWGLVLASCVSFDVSRFQQAAATLSSSNPPAGQMFRLIDQLQREYAAAIARATCSFNVASVAQLEGLYQAGFAAGVATGRSSHYYIDQRLPAEAAQAIASDVRAIRPRLQAIAGCLGPLDAIEASIASVLSSMTGVAARAIYEQITGVYIAIEQRTTTPLCSSSPAPRPTPNPMPGNDIGACMQAKCGNVCQGAMILLGEVSGSPQCVACVKQNCGQ